MIGPKYPGKNNDYCEIKDVMIPMRDGVRLAAEVNLPAKDGKVDFTKQYPVILASTPYMNCPVVYRGAIFVGMDEYAVANGYAMVIVASRGSGRSEGEPLQPGANEGWGTKGRPEHNGWGTHEDGIDIHAWVSKQPWCNGRVFTMGHSYVGATQILPMLAAPLPDLETAVIAHPGINGADTTWPISNGLFVMDLASNWLMTMLPDQLIGHRFAPAIEEKIYQDFRDLGYEIKNPFDIYACMMDWPAKWLTKYGLLNAPVLRHVPAWQKWVENMENPDFFSYTKTIDRKHDFPQACLFYGGWYDLFIENTLKCYEQAVQDAPSPETAKRHHLIVAPVNHGTRIPDEKLFRDENNDLPSMTIDWYNWEQGKPSSGLFDLAPVLIYLLGEERWAAEQQWPLPDQRITKYYLHSGGNANTSTGDGILSTKLPGAELKDVYTDDPHDPVHALLENGTLSGMQDHSENEKRKDVLVYSTPILEEDMEITGWINATLFVSTTGTDADFIVKLMDVYPDGSSMILVCGATRGRFRNGRRTPEAMVPGEIVKLEIPLHATSNVFKAGHRIRIEVMSRNVPLYNPNPNVFIDLRTCTEADYQVAEQSIYHDADHPSSISLPMIPASHKRQWVDAWPYSPDLTGFIDERDANAAVATPDKRAVQPFQLDASVLSSEE